MRVKGIEFASGSKTFCLDFETVPVVWYLLIFILCGLLKRRVEIIRKSVDNFNVLFVSFVLISTGLLERGKDWR
jgi:uncharacterized protein YybS (DUF2232 family)